jgi:peptidoglycan/xylan/chitin deacetylase (PgdA/CDA1 family)
MYHGVGDDRFTVGDFEKQMKYIQRHFTTYWISEVPELLNNVKKINSDNKPAIVLTFDDGLRNNLNCAAPTIDALGLKATFFIVSDLLDGQSMLWNHEVRCRLELMKPDDCLTFIQITSDSELQHAITDYIEKLKTYSEPQRQQILSDLRKLNSNPNFTEQMITRYQIMSKNDVINLPKCIEIGSHTRTHAILDTVDEAILENEIAGSKSELESLLKKPVTTFCYPNGNFTDQVANKVALHYQVGVTVNEGFAIKKDSCFRFKRIPASRDLKVLAYRLMKPQS